MALAKHWSFSTRIAFVVVHIVSRLVIEAVELYVAVILAKMPRV